MVVKRFATVQLMGILTMLSLLVYLLSMLRNGLQLSTSECPQSMFKPTEIQTSPWFTNEELDYVKYGEGKDVLVQPRDPRYLNFIRSQMARPATNRPSLIKSTAEVNGF